MVALWIIVVMLSLLIAVGGALIALRIQYWVLDRTRQEREAWQQAQESRQRTWEVRQGKHILDVERRLGEQVKGVKKEVWDWERKIEENQQILKERVDIEQELARLPHIEDIELPFSQQGLRQQPERWQPPAFYRADLSGRDLSHRYLGRADLREAILSGTNFYMADLSGASLTGANLEGANLIGANLSGADLRGTNLTSANLLVADLHNAALHHATLLKMHNLTPEQLQVAIYDSSTIIDSAIDITLQRIPSVQAIAQSAIQREASVDQESEPALFSVTAETNKDTSPGTALDSSGLPKTDPALELDVPGDSEIQPQTEISRAVDLETEQPITDPSANEPELSLIDEQTADPDITSRLSLEASDGVDTEETITISDAEDELELDRSDDASADQEESQDEGEHDYKIIQLPARVASTSTSAASQNKQSKRKAGHRDKHKGGSRIDKISTLAREEDPQSRAN